MRLPPYAYVPGHWPHPTRSPDGHSFGRADHTPTPLDADAWQSSTAYLEGIELFDHGYYWEAHEAWEGLWIAAGRTGATGDLLNGLIKLAAAGVKLRQGLGPQAARLAALASERFDRAHGQCRTQSLAGLAFTHLHELARQARLHAPLVAAPTEPVVLVFEGALRGDAPDARVDADASAIDEPEAATDEAGRGALEVTLAYHRRSKHLPFRFAPSLGYMDWQTQPDPFRRFEGAPTFPLTFEPVGPLPRYEPAFVLGQIDPASLDATTVARLFYDALALSAWKEAPGSRWPLRVNPSSGNLHPTEGYLVAGPLRGLHDRPAIYHYAPFVHSLELRSELSDGTWRTIFAQLPHDTLIVGLTSIYWREAWKYGERAFRYCQHDAGHAIACVSIAAAGLGWDARLLEGVTDECLAALLGVDSQAGVEAEHPDCLIAVFPGGRQHANARGPRIETDLVAAMSGASWLGHPNTLSEDHHEWPAIDEVAAATKKHRPPTAEFWSSFSHPNDSLELGDSPLGLRSLIHQRRSAVALDGRSGITRAAFHQILLKTVPGTDQIPFTTLPWRPSIDLLLFVHRVEDLPSGLYVLVRDPGRTQALRDAMDPSFSWTKSDGCPSSLGLFLLEEGDARRAAQQTSCDQSIAADGAFAVAMLAEYREPLLAYGPWFYRRLYWETGVIGQVLYLEAEATGIRGTGIGCFFDDLTHRVFGLDGDRFQVLYHFTMGGSVEDSRLQTHPPYDHLARSAPASTPSTKRWVP